MYTCECIKGSLFFDYDSIRCGCSNTRGILYQSFDNNSAINFENIEQIRQQTINAFINGTPPEPCKGCYMLKKDNDNSILNPYTKVLDRIYISHWLHCNCGCIYCTNLHITKGKISQKIKKSNFYDFYPILQILCKNGYVGEKTEFHSLGGEPAVLQEFPDIINLVTQYSKQSITILSSGVKYSSAIANALKYNHTVCISIDSGSREIFKKIKRIDKFNQVISNVKKYVEANSNNIFLKYILISGLNDTKQEVSEFIKLAKELGVKRILLDLDHGTSKKGKEIPSHYPDLFDYFISQTDIESVITYQCKQILEKKKVF